MMRRKVEKWPLPKGRRRHSDGVATSWRLPQRPTATSKRCSRNFSTWKSREMCRCNQNEGLWPSSAKRSWRVNVESCENKKVLSTRKEKDSSLSRLLQEFAKVRKQIFLLEFIIVFYESMKPLLTFWGTWYVRQAIYGLYHFSWWGNRPMPAYRECNLF